MTLNNPKIIEASDFQGMLTHSLIEVDGMPVYSCAFRLDPSRAYDPDPLALLIQFPSEPRMFYPEHPQDSLMFEETVELPAVAPASTTEPPEAEQAVLESAEAASVPVSADAGSGESVDPTPAKTNGKKEGSESASTEGTSNG
jgi:hypothetical protein